MCGQLLSELAKFKMKSGGFSMENYNVDNACEFWAVAGCQSHAKVEKTCDAFLCSLT